MSPPVGISAVKFYFGLAAYAFGALFLLPCFLAAGYRLKTGRFSSGVHLVATIAALVGSLNGIPWKAFFVMAVLDFGSMLVGSSAKSNTRGRLTGELMITVIATIAFGKLAAALIFAPGGFAAWKILAGAAAIPCLLLIATMARAGPWYRNFALGQAAFILFFIFLLPGGRRLVEKRCRGELGSLRGAASAYREREHRFPEKLADLAGRGKELGRLPMALTMGYHRGSEAKVSSGVSPDDAGGWMYDDVAGDANYGSVWINCTHTDSRGKTWNSY